MTFEPQAFQRCLDLIKNTHARSDSRVCNPHLKEEFLCDDVCLVCNMDKNLYDLCVEHIAKE